MRTSSLIKLAMYERCDECGKPERTADVIAPGSGSPKTPTAPTWAPSCTRQFGSAHIGMRAGPQVPAALEAMVRSYSCCSVWKAASFWLVLNEGCSWWGTWRRPTRWKLV